MSCQIDSIRTQLWELIRRHQAEGGQVRNMRIGENSRDGYWGLYSHGSSHNRILCLFGVVQKYYPMDSHSVAAEPHHATSEMFGITTMDALDLEDGFEQFSIFNDSPFYRLGREIALKLEEEAGL